MIDTHCHLDVEAFDADRAAVIERARQAGVRGMLVPAIRPRSWPALIDLAGRFADRGVRCALGVHPQIVPTVDPTELGAAPPVAAETGVVEAWIDGLAGRLVDAVTAAGAVAIGECGLDRATGELELQEHVFRAHLRAARALGKPVVIHVVRAHDLAPRVLREEGPVDGVMHSYSGGADLVPVYASLWSGRGLHFSFAGPITYPGARRPIEAARAVAPDRLLAETDAPDQAPDGHRGGRCEPAMLPAIVAGLAAARSQSAAEVAALVGANARRLFGTWR